MADAAAREHKTADEAKKLEAGKVAEDNRVKAAGVLMSRMVTRHSTPKALEVALAAAKAAEGTVADAGGVTTFKEVKQRKVLVDELQIYRGCGKQHPIKQGNTFVALSSLTYTDSDGLPLWQVSKDGNPRSIADLKANVLQLIALFDGSAALTMDQLNPKREAPKDLRNLNFSEDLSAVMAKAASNPTLVARNNGQEMKRKGSATQRTKMLTASVTLPEGWAQVLDKPSGRIYFYNKECRVSQWQRPEALISA